jgi:glucose-1-phosphate cytidylyltransferase
MNEEAGPGMRTVILAGGLGSRLSEETTLKPKPMVEIGGWPILWHIMQIYSAHGYADFVVACGYKGSYIKEYFRNYLMNNNDVVVSLSTGQTRVLEHRTPPWEVHLIDTGAGTQTGGRLRRCRQWLTGQTFMMTYGDGVGDINITRLVEFHRAHGKLATLTAVRPPARFGGLSFNGDAVVTFSEKPQIGEGWINGGFMVLEPEVMDYIEGDETIWERGPLERLANDGQLLAYRHYGFWQPMDTMRERQLLETLWNDGNAPWKVW